MEASFFIYCFTSGFGYILGILALPFVFVVWLVKAHFCERKRKREYVEKELSFYRECRWHNKNGFDFSISVPDDWYPEDYEKKRMMVEAEYDRIRRMFPNI